MHRLTLLVLPLLALSCESVNNRVKKDDPTGEVTIKPDELEPMRNFVLLTRRVLVAEFVRIELSPQFFEEQMGYTRDPQYVYRSPVQVQKDGTRLVVLKTMATRQKTNFDPDKLPRVYFGGNGLEIRAYREIRIYLRNPSNKERPLFLNITAMNSVGDAKMWVGGRLQHQKPTLTLNSALIWSEEKEEFIHRSSVG
ncbi:MAG: hypothetical protein ACYTEZ_00105 [Planctomycetota bacterium]